MVTVAPLGNKTLQHILILTKVAILLSTHFLSASMQHVSLTESTLCGYLHIKGLTEEYPELTTFFDAEVSSKHVAKIHLTWEANALSFFCESIRRTTRQNFGCRLTFALSFFARSLARNIRS